MRTAGAEAYGRDTAELSLVMDRGFRLLAGLFALIQHLNLLQFRKALPDLKSEYAANSFAISLDHR